MVQPRKMHMIIFFHIFSSKSQIFADLQIAYPENKSQNMNSRIFKHK